MIDFNSYIPVIRNIERRNERNFKTFLLKNMLDKSDNSYIEFRGVLRGGLLRFCRPPLSGSVKSMAISFYGAQTKIFFS